MKLLKLNFGKWSNGAKNYQHFFRTYTRIYLKGYIWTPFVVVKYRWV